MMNKKKTDKKKTLASYKAGGSVFKNCPTCKTKRACSIAKKCMKKVYG